MNLTLLYFIKSVELYKNSYCRSESDLSILRRLGLTTGFSLNTDEPNARNEQEASEEQLNITISPNQYAERNKHQSDNELNTVGGRSFKKDTNNAYLSEGELVSPLPLKPNVNIKKSISKSAIANTVGDDHDSSDDGSTLQMHQRVSQPEDHLRRRQELTKSATSNKGNNENNDIGTKAVVETDF